MTIPVVDERVRYVGASYLRTLNAKTLRDLTELVVVQVEEKPVAVIVPISIYMEIQNALWPSSLIPSLGEFFGSAVEAAQAGSVEPVGEPVGEHDNLGELFRRTLSGHSYRLGSQHECGVLDCPANTVPLNNAERPVVHAIGTDMTPRGKFPTPRVDDRAPLVFDDLDEEPSTLEAENNPPRKSALQRGVENERYLEQHGASATLRKIAGEYDQRAAAIEGICGHCGKPNDKPLCSSCFMAGHRSGNCLQCTGK